MILKIIILCVKFDLPHRMNEKNQFANLVEIVYRLGAF